MARPNLFLLFYVYSVDMMVINTFFAIPSINWTVLISLCFQSISEWGLSREVMTLKTEIHLLSGVGKATSV